MNDSDGEVCLSWVGTLPSKFLPGRRMSTGNLPCNMCITFRTLSQCTILGRNPRLLCVDNLAGNCLREGCFAEGTYAVFVVNLASVVRTHYQTPEGRSLPWVDVPSQWESSSSGSTTRTSQPRRLCYHIISIQPILLTSSILRWPSGLGGFRADSVSGICYPIRIMILVRQLGSLLCW